MAQGFDTKVNSVSIQLTDNVAVWTLLGNGRSIFSPQKHLSHQVLKAFMHNNSIDFKVQWSKCLPVFEEFSLMKDFDIYISYKMYLFLLRISNGNELKYSKHDKIIKPSSYQYFFFNYVQNATKRELLDSRHFFIFVSLQTVSFSLYITCYHSSPFIILWFWGAW